jgi:maltooligosyltrehalose trehalohydrolase
MRDMSSSHTMPFGATLLPTGGTRFALWAPDALLVQLLTYDGDTLSHHSHVMQRSDDGWHEYTDDDAGAGTRYRFQINSGQVVPDPASRFNPLDVAGPSEVVDPQHYVWNDAGWRGRPWHEAVVYELHIGTFTTAGTCVAAMPRLNVLAAMGITAIELMPLAEFPGRRSWGYDGVLPFAPDASYGTPDELKALIDHAHALGMMVLLDVVYNHFGPEGNHLPAYNSWFFNPAHQTPWGAAINFDAAHSETVRDFFIHNALMWIVDYHFDGLRLDAVHAIRDESPIDIVAQIGSALREGPGRERHVHLVLENDGNEARRLHRSRRSQTATATAQWNDDLHHAAHVLLTGETHAYYADFADTPLAMLGHALAEGFVFQGEPLANGEAAPPGEPSAHLPSTAFVAFLQNHDQIGNRAFGDRLSLSADPERLEAMYVCLLLAPQVPMLFMGEEYAASTPFLYFCDYEGELAEAVRKGRRREFGFAEDSDDLNSDIEPIPDPIAVSTFELSKLRWEERLISPHRERLALITHLLTLRDQFLTPLLPSQRGGGTWTLTGSMLAVDWPMGPNTVWRLRVNFGDAPALLPRPEGEDVHALRVEGDASGALRFSPNGVWIGCAKYSNEFSNAERNS